MKRCGCLDLSVVAVVLPRILNFVPGIRESMVMPQFRSFSSSAKTAMLIESPVRRTASPPICVNRISLIRRCSHPSVWLVASKRVPSKWTKIPCLRRKSKVVVEICPYGFCGRPCLRVGTATSGTMRRPVTDSSSSRDSSLVWQSLLAFDSDRTGTGPMYAT